LCHGAQMANFWRFFGSCISSEPQSSTLHSKFALGPHHTAEIRRGIKKRRRKKPQDKNIMYLLCRVAINSHVTVILEQWRKAKKCLFSSVLTPFYHMQWTAQGSVFGAVTFVCVWNISGIVEPICAKFIWKTCLVPRSDEFECQG